MKTCLRSLALSLVFISGLRAQTVVVNYTNGNALNVNRSTTVAAPLELKLALGTASEAGVISGAGGVKKTGAGTLTLSGVNTFSGNLDIAEGTVRAITNAGALGAGTLSLSGGALQLANNSALNFGRNTTVSSDTTITSNRTSNGAGVTHTLGTLTIGANTLTTLKGNFVTSGTAGLTFGVTTLTDQATFAPGTGTLITLASVTSDNQNFTVDGAGNLTVSGALALGTADILKSGAGTLTLSGSNSFDALTVNGGVVSFTSAGGAGTGALTLNGGGLLWSGTNTTDLSSRLTLTGAATFDTGSNNINFATAVEGSGALTKAGAGTLTLAAGTTLGGATTVSAGTLKTTGSTVFGSGGVTLAAGATLSVSATSNQSSTGSLTVLGSATFNFDRATSGAGVTYTFSGLTIGAQTLTLTKTANVTGPVALAFTGTSTFVGSDPNFIGPAGSLFSFENINGGGNALRLNGSGDMTITGVLSNAVSLTMNSPGTLTLSGTASTYSNVNNLNNGITVVSKLADLNEASSLGQPTNATRGVIWLSNTSVATLRYVGSTNSSTNRTLHISGSTGIGSIVESSGSGTLTFSGSITTTSGAKTLTLGGTNTGANTIMGGIPNGSAGAISLIKAGAGTWVLGGTNGYTGTTSINAGTLVVNGSIASSAVTVGNGARLSGSGSVGTLTLSAGSTLAPGNSPGTLSAGNTTWNGGATYAWEINNGASPASTAGTNYDLLSISGTLTINATSANRFTVSLASLLANNTSGNVINFNSAVNSSYTIASASGGVIGFDSNAFTVNSSGFTNNINGGSWNISQIGNSINLNFVAASAIPEPSTYAAIFGALALGFVCLARRREDKSRTASTR